MDAALLSAVLNYPDDDTPRLALADWLTEHGRPERATLIRLMCRWGRGRPAGPRGRNYQSAATTARHLARTTVLCDLPGGPLTVLGNAFGVTGIGNDWGAEVGRGFIDTISLPLPAFLASALFAAHPVRAVTLTDREPIPLSGRRMFGWLQGDHAATPQHLPGELFGRLPPPADDLYVPGLIGCYPTRDLALAALSAACVAHGRAAATLVAA